jgi:AraC family transcriptional regulator
VSVSIEAAAIMGSQRVQSAGSGVCDSGGTSRARLLESAIGIIEDLRGPGVHLRRSAEGFSADFQICLPYRGFFVWHVADDHVVADANQVLFVSGGESFYLSQPVESGYAELIITPDLELLGEVADAHGSLKAHPLFRRRSRRLDLRLQHLRTRLLHHLIRGQSNALFVEEWVITLLRAALTADGESVEPSAPTRRLIWRAKEFLDAHLACSVRLVDVARGVGASPAYLTDVFRRVEGIPLHGYLTQLRLARALVELPHASDLTTLALALGFSSHSHFTAAFRRAFGYTPSQFRESTRRGDGARDASARCERERARLRSSSFGEVPP